MGWMGKKGSCSDFSRNLLRIYSVECKWSSAESLFTRKRNRIFSSVAWESLSILVGMFKGMARYLADIEGQALQQNSRRSSEEKKKKYPRQILA